MIDECDCEIVGFNFRWSMEKILLVLAAGVWGQFSMPQKEQLQWIARAMAFCFSTRRLQERSAIKPLVYSAR